MSEQPSRDYLHSTLPPPFCQINFRGIPVSSHSRSKPKWTANPGLPTAFRTLMPCRSGMTSMS